MEKYRNKDLPVEERVEDLLDRMTFEEKIDQITCLVTIADDIPEFENYIPNGIGNVGAFTVADTVEPIVEYADKLQKYLVNHTRLGIPALIHCEASAGAQFTEADVFPSAIAQASTFDTEVVGEMTDIIRKQMYYVGFRQALSPVVDITRDPRWGRITETYGEDAALTSAMASAFVKGIQGDELKEGVLATAKHFAGHGITEGGLNMGRNIVSERDMREIHCKPFQCAITEAGLKSVMNSYCSVNGEPVVGSKKMLTDILRGEMGFQGFVVSDYLSLDRLVDPFAVAENFEEAGIRAIQAGLDVEYPRSKGFSYKMKESIESGRLSMDIIDQAVRRVLTQKFELGLFENPYPDLEKLKKYLSADQYKLYKLIFNRFMASQMADCQQDTVSVTVYAGDYRFKASGYTVTFDGFTVLYEEATDEKEKKETSLPPLEQGQVLKLKELKSEQKFTQPPARYTEATLIKALEENGIGRPSTYAPIITTIIDRGYVERDQKKLKPTLLGRAVDGLMLEQFPHIVDVDFSAEMEKNLDKVESGKADWHKTVDDFYQGFAASLEQAEKNMEGKKVKVPDEPSSEVCDLCGRPMVIKVGKYGKFLACSGFPECRGTKRLVKDTGGICPKCGKGRMLERKSSKGRIYYGCERYPDCDFMTWDMPVPTKCPKCGSTMFRKGSKLYCAKEGCGYEMPVPKKD